MDIMLQTQALREERMKVYHQLNAMLDDTAGKERSEEDKAVIARMDARIDELDVEIAAMDRRYRREVEAESLRAAQDKAFGDLSRSNKQDPEQADNSLRAWATAALRGERVPELEIPVMQAMKERQMLRAGASPEELRVMNWQTSSGSLVVPTDMARTLYEYLEAGIAAFRVGATMLNTSSGNNLDVPKLGAHAIASGSIPQGTTLAGTDPTFATVQLNAYKYGQLVAVSNELLGDAVFDIGSWLARDIGYGMSRLIDTDLVVGVGTANPVGMTVLAGAGTNTPVTTGGSLITPTYESLVNLVYSVNDEYRNRGGAWLMKDSTAGTLRKLRDGAGGTVGAVLWDPSLTSGVQGGQPDRLLGYPVYIDTNCAAQGSNAIVATFGDFSQYIIRTVGNPVIESDSSVYFATDQTGFRGKWRVDGAHRDVGALNNLKMNV